MDLTDPDTLVIDWASYRKKYNRIARENERPIIPDDAHDDETRVSHKPTSEGKTSTSSKDLKTIDDDGDDKKTRDASLLLGLQNYHGSLNCSTTTNTSPIKTSLYNCDDPVTLSRYVYWVFDDDSNDDII